MLMHAGRDERPWIHLAYGTTGHLVKLRRMPFRSRVSTVTIHELLFADKHIAFLIAVRNSSADVASDMPVNTTNNHDTLANTNTTTTNTDYKEPVYIPPTCDLPFTTNIGLWWLPVEVNNLPNADAPAAAAAAAEAVDVAAENASVESRWCQLRDTIQSTALAVLGRARRQHQDWFDDNDAAIRNLLAEKNRLHKAYADHPTEDNKAASYRSRRQLQQRLREMQDAWTARKAEEIQGYSDRSEWKKFFAAIKAVYGPPTKGTAPLLSADGSTLLTEKTQIL
ncbi:hypothetical protein SprV_1002875400 [Sparganum proliferum]